MKILQRNQQVTAPRMSKFASTPLPHFAEKLSSVFGAKKGQSTISFFGPIAQLVRAEDSYFSNVPYAWKLCKGWCQSRRKLSAAMHMPTPSQAW